MYIVPNRMLFVNSNSHLKRFLIFCNRDLTAEAEQSTKVVMAAENQSTRKNKKYAPTVRIFFILFHRRRELHRRHTELLPDLL